MGLSLIRGHQAGKLCKECPRGERLPVGLTSREGRHLEKTKNICLEGEEQAQRLPFFWWQQADAQDIGFELLEPPSGISLRVTGFNKRCLLGSYYLLF